ncbi:MAG: hypothetical protein OXT09_32590 [Myxococcales bacterium]|nr:hypothetical protein [Myxococcales bacterium]
MPKSLQPYDPQPGDRLMLSVELQPPKQVVLNELTALLKAEEVCVSASGTNKATHEHTMHEQPRHVSSATTLAAGQRLALEGPFDVPADAPASFKASNNRIRWTMEVRVDTPHWPHWVLKKPLLVRAASGAAQTETASAAAAQTETAAPSASATETAAEPESTLLTACESIHAAPRLAGCRDREIQVLIGRTFDFAITVERYYGLDADYRGGRALVGTLTGSERAFGAAFPEGDGARIDAVAPGTVLRGRGRVVEWSILHDRPELLAELRGVAP